MHVPICNIDKAWGLCNQQGLCNQHATLTEIEILFLYNVINVMTHSFAENSKYIYPNFVRNLNEVYI